jgi:hypothetical protein
LALFGLLSALVAVLALRVFVAVLLLDFFDAAPRLRQLPSGTGVDEASCSKLASTSGYTARAGFFVRGKVVEKGGDPVDVVGSEGAVVEVERSR